MLSGEFQINAILMGHPEFFLLAVGLYIIIVILFYWIGRGLDKLTPKNADIIGYFLTGILSVLIIEWAILGNQPGSGRGAIQTGMFAWWAALFIVPRIFTKEEGKPARFRVAVTLITYSVVSLIATIVTMNPAIAGLLMALGFIILNFQFLPFFEQGKKKTWLRVIMWSLVVGMLINLSMW